MGFGAVSCLVCFQLSATNCAPQSPGFLERGAVSLLGCNETPLLVCEAWQQCSGWIRSSLELYYLIHMLSRHEYLLFHASESELMLGSAREDASHLQFNHHHGWPPAVDTSDLQRATTEGVNAMCPARSQRRSPSVHFLSIFSEFTHLSLQRAIMRVQFALVAIYPNVPSIVYGTRSFCYRG